jgi:hypothetical protein
MVRAVDHRLARSNPALLSAPSKKSFSSVSWPILACSVFTSIERLHRRADTVQISGTSSLHLKIAKDVDCWIVRSPSKRLDGYDLW